MNPGSFAQAGMTILIVEDDIATSELFRFYVKSSFEGTVLAAYDGVAGVVKCQEYHPDVVIMDINMPLKNGIRATRELRAIGFENPILVVSAYAELEEENCLKAGADAVISKPVSRDKFLSLIRRHCRTAAQVAV